MQYVMSYSVKHDAFWSARSAQADLDYFDLESLSFCITSNKATYQKASNSLQGFVLHVPLPACQTAWPTSSVTNCSTWW